MVGPLSDEDAGDAGPLSDGGAGDAAAQVLDSLPQITGLVTLTDLLLSLVSQLSLSQAWMMSPTWLRY